MAIKLLEWRPVRVSSQAGVISLTVNRNADTNVAARCWWFPNDPTVAVRAVDLRAGEPFQLQVSEVQQGVLRRLGFQFHAAASASNNPHLFVRVVLDQAGIVDPALEQIYEEDLPNGANFWKLTDGMTLEM